MAETNKSQLMSEAEIIEAINADSLISVSLGVGQPQKNVKMSTLASVAAGLIGVASQDSKGLMPSSYTRFNTSGGTLNLNDCRELWRHYSTLNGTNAPANGYIGFFNVGYNTDWFVQIATVVQTGGTSSMWWRSYHTGKTWTTWVKLT